MNKLQHTHRETIVCLCLLLFVLKSINFHCKTLDCIKIAQDISSVLSNMLFKPQRSYVHRDSLYVQFPLPFILIHICHPAVVFYTSSTLRNDNNRLLGSTQHLHSCGSRNQKFRNVQTKLPSSPSIDDESLIIFLRFTCHILD